MFTAFLVIALVFVAGIAAILLRALDVRPKTMFGISVLLFPLAWLNRFDLNFVIVADRPWALSWGVLTTILGVLFILSIGMGKTGRSARNINIAFAVFCLALLFSSVLSSSGLDDIIQSVHATAFIAIPFLVGTHAVRVAVTDEHDLDHMLLAVAVIGMCFGVMALVTAIAPGFFSWLITTYKTELETGRAFTPIGGASATGMSLLLTYSLGTGMLLGGYRRRLGIAIMIVSFLGILATLARAVLLAFAIANAFLFFGQIRNLFRHVGIAIIMCVLVIVPSVLVLSHYYSLDRFTAFRTEGSRTAREQSMLAAMHYGWHRPVVGGGWGRVYSEARQKAHSGFAQRSMVLDGRWTTSKPHSLFPLIFAEAGFPSLLTSIVFFGTMFMMLKPKRAPSVTPYHYLAHGFRGGALGFTVMCVFQDHLATGVKLGLLFYAFVGLGLAAASFGEKAHDEMLEEIDASLMESSVIQ